MVVVLLFDQCTGTDSAEFSIVPSLVLILSLPGLSLARSGSIIVRRAWTIALLSLVCTAEENLECR